MTPNDLKLWRADMHLTQRQAAKSLGITLKSFQTLERGVDFQTGKPVSIDKRTMLACAAIRSGIGGSGEI